MVRRWGRRERMAAKKDEGPQDNLQILKGERSYGDGDEATESACTMRHGGVGRAGSSRRWRWRRRRRRVSDRGGGTTGRGGRTIGRGARGRRDRVR